MGLSIAITGAGGGLGRAMARRFAAAGHSVILLGRTAATLDKVAAELGAPSFAVVCDVADAASVRTAFATIAERCGTLDVLINNAAVYQPTLVKDASDEQIAAAMTINYAGPIYCTRAAIPLMRRGSHIINISSETVALPHAMFSLYQSSKAGLERFSEALHAELEPDGIRVTMVQAGQMMDEDSKSPASGDVARRFVEENMKRGLDLRTRPVSSFAAVAGLMTTLVTLPPDLNVPQIVLEAWRP
jgi:NAD(P)-dependent dehydrogenase (short-subunit alcohol dehydrogenase family)